jgi:Asp-tRNA(Asn)/Glu-tRNA(Gln) amidotransferase A subunit family amidase
MEAAGATVVDDVSLVDPDRLESARVVGHEFERDFDRYLAERPATPVDSLRELAESGTVAESVERRLLEGAILDTDVDALETDPDYLRSLADREVLRTDAIAGLVEADLDAVVYPPSAVLPVEIPEHQPFSEMRCALAAHTGLPAIVVPAGFAGDGLPVGVELLGRPFAEPRLFELAAGYEATADHRHPPADFE